MRFNFIKQFCFFVAILWSVGVFAQAPSATITKTCNSDLTYTLSVNITNLGGAATVDVYDLTGASIIEAGINSTGIKTYPGMSGTGTYQVRDEALLTSLDGQLTTACVNCDVLSATYSAQTCDRSDLQYVLAVNVTQIGASQTAKITDGVTDLVTGISTVGIQNITVSGAKTVQVIDELDAGCTVDQAYPACAHCDFLTVVYSTTTCNSNLTYDVNVSITAIADGRTVKITDGTTDYYTGVSAAAVYTCNITGAQTLQVIDEADGTCTKTSGAYAGCDPCDITVGKPTDDCSNAPLIDLSQAFYGSTSCGYTSGSDPDNSSSCGNIDNDSWIKFIAGATDVEIDFTVGTCSGGNDGIQLAVYSGSCGANTMTEVAGSCENPSSDPNSNETNTWNFAGLTLGDTYHIWIDGYAAQLCDYSFSPVSGIAVTPPNDLCPDAETIACGGSDIANIILAASTDAPSACGSGGTPGKGTWYKFTGTGQNITVSTDNDDTNYDTALSIYTGSCGAFTCVNGDVGSGATYGYAELTFYGINSTEYYIYVDGDGGAEGQYEISIACTACSAEAGAWD